MAFARQLEQSEQPIVFINVAVGQSLGAMRAAVRQPEFQASLANYPPSAVASPHIFTKLAVPGICDASTATGRRRRAPDPLADARVIEAIGLGHALLHDNEEHVAACRRVDAKC